MCSNNRFIIMVLILLFPFYLSSQVSSEENMEKKVIAIMDFNNTGNDLSLDYLEKTIPEIIITNLAKRGRVEIVERARLQAALEEMKLGISGIVDESSAAQLGKAVGANAILLGSFVSIGKTIRINARLIDVTTGRIITAENVQGDVGKDLFSLMDKIAYSIENKLSAPDENAPEPVITQETKINQTETKPATQSKSAESRKRSLLQKPVFWITTSAVIVTSATLILLSSKNGTNGEKARIEIIVNLP